MEFQLRNLKSLISNATKKPFVRNVITVATGTAFSQAITVLFSPILTRIFSPEAFGIVAVFASIVAILAPWSTLTYAFAIVLPKTDREAKYLLQISMYFATFVTAALYLFIFLFGGQIAGLFNMELFEPYLFIIPAFTFMHAIGECYRYWLTRKEMFSKITKIGILNNLFNNISKVLLGLSFPVPSTLIGINTLTAITGTFFLYNTSKQSLKSDIKNSEKDTIPYWDQLKKTATTYKDFPFLRTPQVFLNAFSKALPALMLAGLFGPAAAGFYGISNRVVALPVQLIGQAVGSVFYPRIAKAVHKDENLTRLILKATLSLAALGIIPYGIIIAIGPWMFEIVFGAEWVTAGVYARWLSIWWFFTFINPPSVQSIPVLNIQQWFLKFEVFATILRALSIFIGFYYLQDNVLTIIVFSVVNAVINLYLICHVLIKSRTISNTSLASVRQ